MNQRDEMMILLGTLRTLAFPFVGTKEDGSHAYYDAVDSAIIQYEAIIKNIYPDFEGKNND